MGMVCSLLKIDQKTISGIKSNEIDLNEFLFPGGEEIEAVVTLDKSWHAIHYALTGSDWDTSTILGKAILGGIEYGDEVGYGQARLLEASEVIKISEELKKITLDDFKQMLRSRSFKDVEIYCFNKNSVESELDYFSIYFVELQKIYTDAAKDGMGILIYVT